MIRGRFQKQPKSAVQETPQGFDDFAVKLGDVMRGERATMGKSLLDVQRELRIKASYISAIENSDPSAFDTPGFIAGYVRSYARYLGMDPDEAFAAFCSESGFAVAHGMSEKASTMRKSRLKAGEDDVPRPRVRDPLAEPKLALTTSGDSLLNRVEPGAIGSTLVLFGLIGGIFYGGYTVLQEVQRVQLAPVDQTPIVLSELDPLEAAGGVDTSPNGPAMTGLAGATLPDAPTASGVFAPPGNEAFDRLYRPQALDVPVVVARDAPISTLDPDDNGLFAENSAAPSARQMPLLQDSSLAAEARGRGLEQTGAPVIAEPTQAEQVVANAEPSVTSEGAAQPTVTVLAVRPAWVRIADGDGRDLLTGIMNAGDSFDVPAGSTAPIIDVGESGAVYFAVAGKVYGPVGPIGEVTRDLPLEGVLITAGYDEALPETDADLDRLLNDLELPAAAAETVLAADGTLPNQPQVLAPVLPGVTIVAAAETWVQVTSPGGRKLFESIMKPGDSYQVPQTAQAPKIKSGNAGGVYFLVNGQTYGPYGESGQVAKNLALSAQSITGNMAQADIAQSPDLARAVAQLMATEGGDIDNR